MKSFLSRVVSQFRRPNKIGTDVGAVGDAYYGEAASKYLQKRRDQPYWQMEQDVVKRLLEEYECGGTVLDVPFGTGRFVNFYSKIGMEIFGLDSSEDMLNAAKADLGDLYRKCEVCVGDAVDLPFKDNQFDLVVCFRFLSHVVSVHSAKLVLRQLSRVCRDKAFIQIRVRNGEQTAVTTRSLDDAMADCYFLEEVEQMVVDSGFRVLQKVDLEKRETYRRLVFVCSVKNA